MFCAKFGMYDLIYSELNYTGSSAIGLEIDPKYEQKVIKI